MTDEKRPYLGVHMTVEQRAKIHKAAEIVMHSDHADATWARMTLLAEASKVLKEAQQC